MADYFEEARQTDTTMTVTTADTTPETTALAAPSTEGPTTMAYPPGVSLATITIGAGRTMFGAPPKLISATVTPIFVGTPHVVVWPAQGVGGIDERRHWHTRCWSARHASRP